MANVTALTSSTQIAKRLSTTGVNLRTDHDPTGSLAEAITAASNDVAFHLASRYPLASLATSDWVASKTTTIAIWYLCQWRNNAVPKSVQEMYEGVIKELQQVQSGKGNVPGLDSGKILPQVVTQRTAWDRFPKERVVDSSSTGRGEGIIEYRDYREPNPI